MKTEQNRETAKRQQQLGERVVEITERSAVTVSLSNVSSSTYPPVLSPQPVSTLPVQQETVMSALTLICFPVITPTVKNQREIDFNAHFLGGVRRM